VDYTSVAETSFV